MRIYLNGVPLPGYDQRLTAQGQIARKDLSGESSSTGAAHQGWKAWVLGVSCKVRFADPDDLLTLRVLFQARQNEVADETDVTSVAGGGPLLYSISDPTAAALGILEVRFADFFQVDPDEKARFWHVKFTLIEHRSIPERTSERTPPGLVATPTTPTGTQDTAGLEDEDFAPGSESYFESLLAKFDAEIGKRLFGEGT